jgi:hypothetical protein
MLQGFLSGLMFAVQSFIAVFSRRASLRSGDNKVSLVKFKANQVEIINFVEDVGCSLITEVAKLKSIDIMIGLKMIKFQARSSVG